MIDIIVFGVGVGVGYYYQYQIYEVVKKLKRAVEEFKKDSK